MEITLLRIPQGFIPADDEAREGLNHYPVGSIARLDVKLMRNYEFLKKFMALMKVGFDFWAERQPQQDFKGMPVLPEFDRFRKDVTIMAGYFTPVWNIKGEMRVEAESISFANMSEDRFQRLFDAVLKVLLSKIFKDQKQWTESEVRRVVDQIAGFM